MLSSNKHAKTLTIPAIAVLAVGGVANIVHLTAKHAMISGRVAASWTLLQWHKEQATERDIYTTTVGACFDITGTKAERQV